MRNALCALFLTVLLIAATGCRPHLGNQPATPTPTPTPLPPASPKPKPSPSPSPRPKDGVLLPPTTIDSNADVKKLMDKVKIEFGIPLGWKYVDNEGNILRFVGPDTKTFICANDDNMLPDALLTSVDKRMAPNGFVVGRRDKVQNGALTVYFAYLTKGKLGQCDIAANRGNGTLHVWIRGNIDAYKTSVQALYLSLKKQY